MLSAFQIIVFIMQTITTLLIVYIIYRLLKFRRSINFEKRFSPFSVEVIDDEEEPFFDTLTYSYRNIRDKLSIFLIKIKIFNTYSTKYEKYEVEAGVTQLDNMNYISNKIFMGLSCVLLLLFSCIFRYQHLSFTLIIFVFLVGFFALDVYLIINDKIRHASIEKDMSQAIIVMNNAFKSGYSIMQAIYLVATELDGAISDEFMKMYMDITFGLNMEVVFKRFAERVDCVESRYMATSLAVVNKTGGNIIQVFNAVERNSLARKKLKDELASVSSSAKAMFKILIFIPIVLVLLLLFLNPTYFVPLFTTEIGLICLIASVLIYTIYIIIIRRIVYMEVKL